MKFEGLQAARAIAAFMVAYFHSYVAIRGIYPESVWRSIPWLKQHGFIGVHLFFAISGFVICLVVSKPGFTLRGFIIKRIFRIYPMYWIVMIIILGLIYWGKYSPQSIGHFIYSMTLLPEQSQVYDPSWTLELEVLFYAIAAITVPLVGVGGLAATLALLAFIGWCFSNPWSYHIIADAHVYFLGGVAVFMVRGPISRLGGVIPLIVGCIVLVLVRDDNFVYMTPIAMAALLAGFLNLPAPWSRTPLRWLVLAGDASYSIYLLHYIVFLLCAMLPGQIHFTLPFWTCELWRYGCILLCCFVSYGTWLLIEKPFILVGDRLTRSPPSAIIIREG